MATLTFVRNIQPGDRVIFSGERVVTIEAVQPEPWAAQVSLAYQSSRSGAIEWHPWSAGTQLSVI